MKTIENYKFRDMILRIGKKAVKEAQARSLANGVPYFQMPSGEITSKIPKEYEGVYN